MIKKTRYKTTSEDHISANNRKELAMILKACLDPDSPIEWDIAYRSAYSPFIKKLLNLDLDRAINRLEIEEILEFRAYLAAEEKRKEREAILKDEIARGEAEDRRLFDRKEDIVKTMQGVVEGRDLEELKELRRALPQHIKALQTEITVLEKQITVHTENRNTIAAQVQTANQTKADGFMNYLRENPNELILPGTNKPIVLTEPMIQAMGEAVSKTDIFTVSKVNPEFEKKIVDTSFDRHKRAVFCVNANDVIKQLKVICAPRPEMTKLGIDVPLTAFYFANKDKPSFKESIENTKEEREAQIKQIEGWIEESEGINETKSKLKSASAQLARAEIALAVIEGVLKPELGIVMD